VDIVGNAVASLVVTTVAGLTVVAYKHPRAYAKLGLFLLMVANLFLAGGVVWNFSNSAVKSAVSSMLLNSGMAYAKITEIESIIGARLAPWLWYFIVTGTQIYLIFLWTFPYWLLEEAPPKGVNTKE
jgi:hypothetical protein